MTLFDDDIENCLRTLASRIREATGEDDFLVSFSHDLRSATLLSGEELVAVSIDGDVLDALNDTVEEISEVADMRGQEEPTSYWLQSRGVIEYRLTYGDREEGSITLP